MAEPKQKRARATRAGKGGASASSKTASDGKARSAARAAGGRSKAASRSAGGKAPERSGKRSESNRDAPTRERKQQRAKSNGASTTRRQTASRAQGMSAMEAARAARRHIAELLGRPVEGVLGVDRDHGNWLVTAQVVELERIPNTMDVLGDYEAVLDKDGEVVVCRRTHRYRRGQVDEGQ